MKGWSLGTLGGEWQCDPHCHSGVNVLVGTFRGEWQCREGRVTAKGWGPGISKPPDNVKDHPAV